MKAYHQGQLDFFCAVYAVINALKLTGALELSDARHILAESLREISLRPLLWEAVLNNQTDYYWLLRWMFGYFGQKRRFAFRVGRLPEAPLSNKQRKMLQSEAEHGAPKKKLPRGLYGLTDEELCAWIDLAVPPACSLDDVTCDALRRQPQDSRNTFLRELKWSLDELWPLLQSWLPVRSLFGGFNVEQEQKRCLILRFHRHLYPSHPPLISHWTTGREFHRDTLQLFDCTADKHATHSLPLRETALAELQLAPDRLLRLEPDSVFFIEKV